MFLKLNQKDEEENKANLIKNMVSAMGLTTARTSAHNIQYSNTIIFIINTDENNINLIKTFYFFMLFSISSMLRFTSRLFAFTIFVDGEAMAMVYTYHTHQW